MNVLETLRARREALSGERLPLYFPVPGYGSDLHFRFGMIDFKELRKLIKRGEKARAQGGFSEINHHLDLIVRCCTEVVTVEGGEYISLPGGPFTLDGRLAETLGYEATNARQALLGLVGNNELAIGPVFAALYEWLTLSTDEDDEEFLGESKGESKASEPLPSSPSLGSTDGDL